VLVSGMGTIVSIVLQIKEAVEMVHQNEQECRKISTCVDTNSGILKYLVENTDITKVEVMRCALEDVKTSFEEALEVVKQCQTKQVFCRFILAKDMAKDLDRVQREIGQKMQLAGVCSAVQGAAVATRIHNTVTTAIRPPPPPHAAPPPRGEEENIEVSPEGITRFSLSLLKKATADFSDENQIGIGGYAVVYKGVHDGQEVAIKKFHFLNDIDSTIFCAEFNAGTKLQHKNVVSLLGYYIDIRRSMLDARLNGIYVPVEERINILVLGYVGNWSMEDIVTGKRRIDWCSYFKIIQEIAQGLNYIHRQHVVHLDLKPANILLDSDMTPVIIDFGLSQVLGHADDDIVLDEVMGTVGYMAPEQYSASRVSAKSDMFAFGITLIRTTVSVCTLGESWYDPEMLERMLEEAGGLEGFVHPTVLVHESQLMEIERCLKVGQLCTESEPENRPTAADVVDMLSGKKMLPTQKKKIDRVATKNVERQVTKKLGRADSRT